MKKLLSVISLVMCATACTVVPDDYKLGDGIKAVIELKQQYCDIPDSLTKQLLLEAIKEKDPDYTGVCDVY